MIIILLMGFDLFSNHGTGFRKTRPEAVRSFMPRVCAPWVCVAREGRTDTYVLEGEGMKDWQWCVG